MSPLHLPQPVASHGVAIANLRICAIQRDFGHVVNVDRRSIHDLLTFSS
jgi:hypothetical protein